MKVTKTQTVIMKADIIKMTRKKGNYSYLGVILGCNTTQRRPNKSFRGIGTINKRGLSAKIVDHSKNKKETSVCPLTCPKKLDLLGIINKSTTQCR